MTRITGSQIDALPYHLKPTDQLYFLHIAKTGGRTLEAFLKERLRTEETGSAGFNVHNGYPASIPHHKLKNHTLLSGHMGYHFLTFFSSDRKPLWVTMLRDPVERVVSHYYFLRNLMPMNEEHFAYYVQEMACSLSLKEFVEREEVSRLVKNHQLYSLVDHPYHEPAERERLWGVYSDDELTAIARYRLENECFFFGVTEYFSRSLFLLCYILDWDLPADLQARRNITPKKPESIPPEVVESIREKTSAENNVYQYAVELFNRRYDEMVRRLLVNGRNERKALLKDLRTIALHRNDLARWIR